MRIFCVIAATLFCFGQPPQDDPLIVSIQSALDESTYASVLEYHQTDLDLDGTIETIAITCESIEDGHPLGGELVVLQEIDGELCPVCRKTGLNPWKLEIGDVDGDGFNDVAVGVWKESPFDQVMAKRTFFYYWDGESLQPKWLGSRLSRRFDDFILFDINSDDWDELLALEIGENDTHRVAVYRWDVFGFEWLGCSDEQPELEGLSVDDGIPVALALSGQFEIIYDNDQVELVALDMEEN